MASLQRTKNDRTTDDRREIEDEIRRDNRIKNDALTAEKREKADQVMSEHRLRNDEMTDARRKANDRNPWRTLAISLLIMAALAVGAYYLLTYYHFI
jgi:hypothetical protein